MGAKFWNRKRVRLAAAMAVIAILYYGLPVAFLKSPVQDHLASRYGIHVEIGSVRVSIRGLIAADMAAVWPGRAATLSVEQMILSPNLIKSVQARKIVLDRMRWYSPILSIRLPEPSHLPDESAAPALDTSSLVEKIKNLLPERIDLTLRDGKIHLLHGQRSDLIHEVEAQIRREPSKPILAWIKIASRDIGMVEFTYEEGRSLDLSASHVSLPALSEISGSPHKFYGQMSASLHKEGDSVSGRLNVDQLFWTGPLPGKKIAGEPLPAAPDTDSSPAMDGQVQNATGMSGVLPPPPRAPDAGETIALAGETELAAADTQVTSLAPAETALSLPQAEEVQFIFPPLDVRADWDARWSSPTLILNSARIQIPLPQNPAGGQFGELKLESSGKVEVSHHLECDLDFYASEFDEPSLEGLSRHFYVLRYLHAFLETISSPSRLQAKMHLAGPLLRPAKWRYEGLIDIRPDMFSYAPFRGQYSFLGTVEFNERGVTIPEIFIPFGQAPLTLSGVAADYSSHSSNLTLKGTGLGIADMLYYYVPAALKPEDSAAAAGRSGLANVDLNLARDASSAWALTGKINFKKVSLPIRLFNAPLQAYGQIEFSANHGDGRINVKLGSFETVLNPFFKNVFTPEMSSGIFFRQDNILWDALARHAVRPLAFLPAAGRGDVAVRFTSVSRPAMSSDTPAPDESSWELEGVAEIRDAKVWLPNFAAPAESVAAHISVESGVIRLDRVSGVLARTSLAAEGTSSTGQPRHWALKFSTPALYLHHLLENIRPAPSTGEGMDFEVKAAVTADKLKFHAFEFSGVFGGFKIAPGNFAVEVETPVLTRFRGHAPDRPWSEISFALASPLSLKKIFSPESAIAGNIQGQLRLKSSDFSDSRTIGGSMDLFFDHLVFGKAPPLLQLLDLMRFSLTDAIVFDPFEYKSAVENGIAPLDMDLPSNNGRWKIRGRLGLDATFMPRTESDSGFHVTFFPKENVLTQILHESKILSLFAGRREGIVLDFRLVGNYNKPNILWTEEPLVSIIRGRLSELVPGFLGTQSPTSDTPKTLPKEPAGDSPKLSQ